MAEILEDVCELLKERGKNLMVFGLVEQPSEVLSDEIDNVL